jgi:hypothetical protein
MVTAMRAPSGSSAAEGVPEAVAVDPEVTPLTAGEAVDREGGGSVVRGTAVGVTVTVVATTAISPSLVARLESLTIKTGVPAASSVLWQLIRQSNKPRKKNRKPIQPIIIRFVLRYNCLPTIFHLY